MSIATDTALKILKVEEGFRAEPYYCSEHYPTIGYGVKLGEKYEPLPKIKWTQGEALKKLAEIIESNEKIIQSNPDLYRCYFHMNDARKAVMLSIVYQIGIYGALKFKKMLAAMEMADFSRAADEMLNSLAARQTPARWKRNAEQMRSGEMCDYYTVAP